MLRDMAEMAWIGDDDMLDVANTIVLGGSPAGSRDVDFFADVALTAAWRGRIRQAALAQMPLVELAHLRQAVRVVLDAVSRGAALPDGVREELNQWSAESPITMQLDPDGTLTVTELSTNPRGKIAREALQAVAQSQKVATVRRCPAPSCGMFFRPSRTDQTWCTTRCGTRARAARHRNTAREAAHPPNEAPH